MVLFYNLKLGFGCDQKHDLNRMCYNFSQLNIYMYVYILRGKTSYRSAIFRTIFTLILRMLRNAYIIKKLCF